MSSYEINSFCHRLPLVPILRKQVEVDLLLRVRADHLLVERDAEARTLWQRKIAVHYLRQTQGDSLTQASEKSLKYSWILKFGIVAATCRFAAVETCPPTLWGATST